MSLLGLIGGLVLLIVLVLRGAHLLIAAPISALLISLSSGMTIFPQEETVGAINFIDSYMNGFTGFFKSWFFMFLLGAIFGKVMEHSGTADSVANWIVVNIGLKHASLAVVIACAVLTYGGVSLFIVAFSVYSLALSLFKKANLPRRFLPAVIAFGSATFTMTSAGSPEIQNWIPMQFLGTTPYAGWQVSIAISIFIALTGYFWLQKLIKKAITQGECFQGRQDDPNPMDTHSLPNPKLGLLPLFCVLFITFIGHEKFGTSALILALSGGIALTYLINYSHFKNPFQAMTDGATGSLIAIANTCAVVGFGAVAKETPAFSNIVELLGTMPGGGLFSAAIAVSVICALTGSASGGQTIALPLLTPLYIGADVDASQRVDPEELHRVVTIASGGLDAMPHNGYVVTLIRSICGESHKEAYIPLAKLTVVIPLIGAVLAIILFNIF